MKKLQQNFNSSSKKSFSQWELYSNFCSNIFSFTNPNLVICGKINDDITFDSNFFVNKNIYCNNKKNYNQTQNNNLCYIKNLNTTCNICGKNFFLDKNNNNNNSFINCIDKEFVDESCYYTCKSCNIKGNETQHNCIECKTDYLYEFNIANTYYKNCFKNNTVIFIAIHPLWQERSPKTRGGNRYATFQKIIN